jgi:hexosaminidase
MRMDDPLAALVVPQPVQVQRRPGELRLASCPVVRPVGHGPQQQLQAAVAAVRQLVGQLPWPGSAANDGAALVTVDIDTSMSAEAYRLRIDDDGITIAAADKAGAVYAVQTIRQLLPDDAWRTVPRPASQPWNLPCAEITDRPAMPWRGAHIDVARHFFTKRELLALTDALAALKLNRLHLHLTDDQGWRIESPSHPALHEIGSYRPQTLIGLNREEPKVYDGTPHGGYYTLADLAEIAAFAAQRGMALVPEIDLPGHSSAMLAALPEFGAGGPPPGGYQVATEWGIFSNLIAPLPESMKLLRDIFGELVGATRAEFVHIGGDECPLESWRADARIDAVRRDRGLATAEDLHGAFLNDLASMLADDFAARAVVWDEGFVSCGDALRADTVVMSWRGMQIAREAAQAGHDVVAVPVFPTYFDYFQERRDTEPAAIGGPLRIEDVAAFAPAPADWPEQARGHVIGTQFQTWTEYIPDGRSLEYMIFPRACALADVAWSGGPTPWAAGGPDQPALQDRVAAHLRRLDAAGLEYRPLSGPLPWQQGGSGPRRHRRGYEVAEVMTHLNRLANGEDQLLSRRNGSPGRQVDHAGDACEVKTDRPV